MFKFLKNRSIVAKLSSAFAILLFLILVNGVISYNNLKHSIAKNDHISEVLFPSSDAIQELKLMVTESKMLITNWVYLKSNMEDKERLKKIHAQDYLNLKGDLNNIAQGWNENAVTQLNQVFTKIDTLFNLQKNIMGKLNTFESYEDFMLVVDVQEVLEGDINRVIKEIKDKIVVLQKDNTKELVDYKTSIKLSLNRQTSYVIYIGLIVLLIGVFITIFLAREIRSSVAPIKAAVGDLSYGRLPGTLTEANDEMGQIAAAVNQLIKGIKSTSEFSEKIGMGQYQAEYTPLSNEDVMGNSLLTMRDNLVKVADEEKKREWGTVGIAKFAEILRSADDLSTLSDNIISNLVKYTNANQGNLFVVNDDNKDHAYLELKACYAWNKKKHLNKKIEMGEGLTGQCWQEADVIFITDVPNDYIEITSGLGGANPKCILIVPLKVNGIIYGVLEIASFNVLQNNEVSFVEKLAENIASTVSVAKINTRTKRLLEDSQRQEEALRSQEEEMRQNMEEMMATQEEMQRKEGEMKKMVSDLKMGEERSRSQEEEMRQNMEEMLATQEEMERKEAEAKKIMLDLKQSEEHSRAQEEELRQNLEEMAASQEEISRFQKETNTQMSIINRAAIVSKTDRHGKITFVNDEFCRIAQYTREELMGKNHNILRHPDMPAEAFVDLWKTISSGKVWRGEVKNKAKDGSHYWVDATIAPIMGDDGKPKEYMAVRHVITAWKNIEEELKSYKEGKKK